MTRVALPEELRLRILQEARAAFPRECCGLVEGGVEGGDEFRVTALHAARNLAPESDRFEIAPEDHIRALKAARANGRRLIGCYHSHPNAGAEPSATDKAGAGEENFLWLIAAGGRLEAFVYRRGEFSGAGRLIPG
ncbi:MAG TPA: M67 family metallopeptidase [Rhizomicrobium sp.]|jgi:proteasome lid subunit RPN8/RPN11|nr:M67 family metallopeptidase [Rhizomicrobium sp.]